MNDAQTVKPFLELVELLGLEGLSDSGIAEQLGVSTPEFLAMYRAATMASRGILDPGKNYLVLDASKHLLIMDIKDFKNVAVYGAFAAVGGWAGYVIWKRDIRPLVLSYKKRKWNEKIARLRAEGKLPEEES